MAPEFGWRIAVKSHPALMRCLRHRHSYNRAHLARFPLAGCLSAKQPCRKGHLLDRFRTTNFPTIRRFILTFQAIWLSESFLLRMVCFRNVYSFSP